MKSVAIYFCLLYKTRSSEDAYICIYVYMYIPRKTTRTWPCEYMITQAWMLTYKNATRSRVDTIERPRLAPAKHW